MQNVVGYYPILFLTRLHGEGSRPCGAVWVMLHGSVGTNCLEVKRAESAVALFLARNRRQSDHISIGTFVETMDGDIVGVKLMASTRVKGAVVTGSFIG